MPPSPDNMRVNTTHPGLVRTPMTANYREGMEEQTPFGVAFEDPHDGSWLVTRTLPRVRTVQED